MSASAAILYGAFACGWLLLNWRDGRHGLLFVAGPLLAGVGLLPLVPLVLQRAEGTLRRAAHGALAVLSAALLAGVAGNGLPFTSEPAEPLGIGPLTTVTDAGAAVWSSLLASAFLTGAVVLAATASALLPWARHRSRYGVAAIGLALTAASVIAGAGVGSTIVVFSVWAVAATFAAVARSTSR